jgi:hypothetical protein
MSTSLTDTLPDVLKTVRTVLVQTPIFGVDRNDEAQHIQQSAIQWNPGEAEFAPEPLKAGRAASTALL